MTFESTGGIFVCPICKKPLSRKERSLLCENRHSYDISKKGHVNLLLSSKGEHGDNKEMVAARRAFLEKGYYQHMRDAVQSTLLRYLPKGGTLLDSGCGEGYYTEAFAKLPDFSVYGIDISSNAASLAAKKVGIKGVAVASAYSLPIADESCGALTNIFAPFSREEFLRILKPGGYLIDVIPAERHPFELKEAIYKTPYENKVQDTAIEGFRFLEKISTEKKVLLQSSEDIATLLKMTPYFYRTDKEGLEKAAALQKIAVSASFYLLVYQKQ